MSDLVGLRQEDPAVFEATHALLARLVAEGLVDGVRHGGALREAIWFGRVEPVPDHARFAYRLNLDEYQGQLRVQMVVEGMA